MEAKRLSFWLVATLFCPIVSESVLANPASAVGEVTFVLGRAYQVDQVGARSRVHRGDAVSAGDRIETLSNGHVHVRFVDNALVSVRPRSELVISQYVFNPEDPEASTVKFELLQGVTRAISGDAAKAAKERFRLNTPVAAIGVRGTDFVVSADAFTTRALVNEGAIILAPFSDTCSVEAYGPCTLNSLVLGSNDLALASIQQSETLPRIVNAQSLRSPDMLQGGVRFAMESVGSGTDQQASSASDSRMSNDVLLESVTTVQLRQNAEVAASAVQATDFIPLAPLSVKEDGSLDAFDFTPPALLNSQQLKDRQLVWGRFFSQPLETDRLTLTYAQASDGRSIAIGNTQFGLFRRDSEIRPPLAELGLVGFQLSSAQAVYNSQSGVLLMTVAGGNLDIDFQQKSFQTSLSLESALTGQVKFEAGGKLFDGGFLRALQETQSVTGSISHDGSEAGYQFSKHLTSGTISGLTLWDSKK